VDGTQYAWERPIATQQAGFVMLAQCRAWLPDPVGGVYWFTPDDPYTSCFIPLYCGMSRLPESYTTGTYGEFSFDSAWWVSNVVSNLTYDKWSRVVPDVLAAQIENEERFVAMMPAIDAAAAAMLESNPEHARRFLTDWSVAAADRLFEDWRKLAGTIIAKHVDGYVRDGGRSRGIGYSEDWLRKVVAEQGQMLQLPKAPGTGEGDH
jgi:dipeptidase